MQLGFESKWCKQTQVMSGTCYYELMYKISKNSFFILFVINLVFPLFFIGSLFANNVTHSLNFLTFLSILLQGLLLASFILFLYQAYKVRVFTKNSDGNYSAVTSDYVVLAIGVYMVAHVFIKFLI